jgi:exodeoxyribonuclease VIII
MGTRPGSAIVSIGAVLFDFDMTALRVDKFAMEFHRRISLQSCLSIGLTVDGPTVEWWLRQSDAARQALLNQPADVNVVLLDFMSWIDLCQQYVSHKVNVPGADRPLRIWANGASFDPVLLEEAYRRCGLTAPWSYRDTRDMRTLMDLAACDNREFAESIPRQGESHDALSDARWQALAMREAWARLRAQGPRG